MKILITESQLKYLIINEGPPDINNPQVPEELLYGYAPVAPIDGTLGGEFSMWLYSKFPSVYNKYATGRNWDTNTINTIRQEYGKGFGGDVNVGKSWDAYKKYTANQKKSQQQQQQYQQQYQQQQQKQQLQKIANDYQAQQDAKTNQFVAKQDVLDPNKIQGATYAQFCQTWDKKYPGKPCPQPTVVESGFASGNWEYLDWIIDIVLYLNPQLAAANKIRLAFYAIYEFYVGYQSQDIVTKITKFLGGISYSASAVGFNIPMNKIIPKWLTNFINKIQQMFEKSRLGKIIERLGKTGTKISSNFTNSPMWVQVLVMIVVDLVGDLINNTIEGLVTYFLNPLYNLINKYFPKIASYISIGIQWLNIIKSMINDGKELKKDSEIATIYKEVKGIISDAPFMNESKRRNKISYNIIR